ncbi:hypothetical protein EON62_04955 [archaeon]|nr:MAG: hypothetical protein EON62_04955 [archaeon]
MARIHAAVAIAAALWSLTLCALPRSSAAAFSDLHHDATLGNEPARARMTEAWTHSGDDVGEGAHSCIHDNILSRTPRNLQETTRSRQLYAEVEEGGLPTGDGRRLQSNFQPMRITLDTSRLEVNAYVLLAADAQV